MASYTDIMPQFTPYVQQLPVEEMFRVGVEKQRMYQEGVQKIQSQIDSIAGLDIMRDVDKAYLQSKINELGNNLKTVAAGDFSNFQLVNSVGGMIKQIGNDRIIMAATQSAAHDKKQGEYMEDARKKGTLSPSNQYNYLKNRQNYLNSGLTDESGNPITFSYSYKDFFDVDKFAKETFDAVKPDGWTLDQVYETDANGNIKKDANNRPIFSPIMIRTIKEGRMPEKVKQTISQIFSDPRVSQQLSLDGEYNYRNYDATALSEKIGLQKTELMKGYTDKMAELNLQKSLGKDVQSQIDALQITMNNTESAYNEYVNLAKTNPDVVRGSLYKDDVRSRFSTMFGQMTTKEETLLNPGWEANFKLMAEANEQSRFAQRLQFDKDKEENEMLRFKLKYEQDERLGKGKGKGGAVGMTEPTLGDKPSAEDAEFKFDNDYSFLGQQFSNAADELIWEGMFSKIPGNQQELSRLLSTGKTKDEAISLMINATAAKNNEDPSVLRMRWAQKAITTWNNLTPTEKDKKPIFGNLVQTYSTAERNFKTITAFKTKIDDDLATLSSNIKTKEDAIKDVSPVNVTLNGKQYNLTKEDIYNIALVMSSAAKSTLTGGEGHKKNYEDAMARLSLRGLLPVWQAITKERSPSELPELASSGTLSAIKLIGNEVKKVTDVFNSKEFEAGSNFRRERIEQYYGSKPTLNIPLLTGDNETDRGIMIQLRNIAGEYRSGQTQNMSSDFKAFASHVAGDLKDYTVQAVSTMGPNNVPVVEIVLYGPNSKRVGGMTIQRDEAIKRLGIDVDNLYTPPEVSVLESYINSNGEKTCKGDPSEKLTYTANNDAYFDKSFFPLLQNLNVTVKANIAKIGGQYVPYIYVSDGVRETKEPRQIPGGPNLNVVMAELKKQMTPVLIQSFLMGY